ncbi:MAG: hypothetical protein JWO03_2381 [Bacteroidetes bacterium]|nr:hypothetical protein [Bacteroidota bacterium]
MIGKKTKRGLIITAVVIVTSVVAVIACASPIGKYIIESYVGPTILGRHVKTSYVYVNPFTGYVHIKGLKIYEPGGDSITILRADELNVHYNILKTLTKNYEFTDADLVRPEGWIIQDHRLFNFTDLIIHFSPKHPRDTTKPKVRHPLHINVLNFKITDGVFHYVEKSIPINYCVKHVNISSSGKWWAQDSMHVVYDFMSGTDSSAGRIKGDGYINFYTLDFGFKPVVQHYDMQLLEQYLRDLAYYASLRGLIDADIRFSGNFKDKMALNAKGLIEISDFHVGKSPTVDIASIEKLSFSTRDLRPRDFQYVFDSLAVHHPFLVYERYDHLDNLRYMFGAKGEKARAATSDPNHFNLIVEIGRYVKVIVQNFLQSKYRMDHLNIYRGELKFNDYSLREKFYIGADSLFLHADSIYKENSRLHVSLSTVLRPHGTFRADLSVNPATYEDFDLHYRLNRAPVALFNPYLITYTSFPLDRGIFEFNGTTLVRSNQIHSDNHLLVLDTRVAKRQRKDDTKWIPMPLIMSILRNPGNAIDINIPIVGDLRSPHFRIWNVVGQILENIIIKPPLTPYIARTKAVENVVEKSLSLKWEMRSSELTEDQADFLEEMSRFLHKDPHASIAITSNPYIDKEKEYILMYEAKKRYFMASQKRKGNEVSEEDSLMIDKMSVKDSGLVRFLAQQQGVELLYSGQERADHMLGKALVNAKFEQLLRDRQQRFLSYFKEDGTASQVIFIKVRDVIPFNGFSNYKVEYKGETPEKLIKAYDNLVSLNNMAPRKKYAFKRKAKAGMIIDEKKLKQNKP